MYFSDEIYLVTEQREKDALKQFKITKTETGVWCDLSSVSGNETSGAGQNGHVSSARAIVHTEDYSGEKIARYDGSSTILKKGYYEIYRTYAKGDVVELYLTEKEGVC